MLIPRTYGWIAAHGIPKLQEDHRDDFYIWYKVPENNKKNKNNKIKNILPLPENEWSWVVRIIARKRKPEDKGLGDTLEREIGYLGGNTYKRWYKKLMPNGDCGCARRQIILNIRYPYKNIKNIKIDGGVS